MAFDVLLLHGDQELAAPRGHGRPVEVGAGEEVPLHGQIATAHAVHVPRPRRDVDPAAQHGGGRLQHEVTLVGGGARVAQELSLRDDPGPLVPVPVLRLQRVERVHPAALDPNVLAAVEEEAAAVGVAAVGGRLRHRQAPELLAGAERDGAVGRDAGVGELERVAAPRAGAHDVLVVGAGGVRILEHGGAALDDVVVLVLPDDVTAQRVEAAQAVVVAADEDEGLAAVDDDIRHAGPAAAGPLGRRVGVVLARGPAVAEPRLPHDVEALGDRSQAVEAARVVAQERADLDAVAGERGDRGRRHGAVGHRRAAGPATATGHDAPQQQDDEDDHDDQRDAATPRQLASACGGAAPCGAPGDAGGRLDDCTILRRAG